MVNPLDPFGFRRFGSMAMPGFSPPPAQPPAAPSYDGAVAPSSSPEPGASAYLGGATEMQDVTMGEAGNELVVHGSLVGTIIDQPEVAVEAAPVAEVEAAPVVETAVVAATPVYPIGNVDFNKPFEIRQLHNDESVHTDVVILTVLGPSNDYPIIIKSVDDDGDEVVNHFDADGVDMGGDLEIENFTPEVFPRTIYIVIDRNGRELVVDSETYDSEDAAVKDATVGDVLAVFPITILEDTFKPWTPAPVAQPVTIDNTTGNVVIEGDDDQNDVVETASEAHVESEEEDDNSTPALPEGAVYVNGVVRKPGDKVNANRAGRGNRLCTVIKTRSDPYKSMYIQADNGTEEPYWARNTNIRNY